MYILYLFIFKLFLLISGENIYNIDIKPGIIKYTIKKGEIKTLQFTAIDDGYYLITFDNLGYIKEAVGDVHPDIAIFESEGLRTGAYIQNFKKGDYFKMTYPYKRNEVSTEHTFKIQEIDSDIKLRLLTEGGTYLFKNLYLTDCSEPIYILFRNPSHNDYSTNNDIFFTKSILHSGEFYASYQLTDYSPYNDGSLLNSFIPFNLFELTILPNKLCFYVIELKCKAPGMMTFIFFGKHDEETSKMFTYYSFENKGITQNKFNFSHELRLSIPKYTGTYHLEVFNINGCAKFDMKSLGGETYECKDFFLNTTFKDLKHSYDFQMDVISSPFWFFSIYHAPNDDGFILEKEKIEYLCEGNGMRIIIPINSKKKYIEIKSSIPKFFWSLDFTQKDYSYLPVPSGSSFNYINGMVANIRNPYSFTQNKKTNYNWYIIIYHYSKTTTTNFSYQYIGEENEEEIPNDNNNKNFVQNPIFWVIIIVIIIILIAIIAFFIFKKMLKNRQTTEENLLKNKDFNNLVAMYLK